MESPDGAEAQVFGDGVVAARTRDGQIHIHNFEHVHNAPNYPNYSWDLERRKGYLSQFSEDFVHEIHGPDGKNEIADTGNPEALFFPREEFDLVMVLSDGASSFRRPAENAEGREAFRQGIKNRSMAALIQATDPVPLSDVVAQVMAFKGTAGEFLVRRCQRFLNKFCVENGWVHADDFSAAAVYMENEWVNPHKETE